MRDWLPFQRELGEPLPELGGVTGRFLALRQLHVKGLDGSGGNAPAFAGARGKCQP